MFFRKKSKIFAADICCPKCNHAFTVRYTTSNDKTEKDFTSIHEYFEKLNKAFSELNSKLSKKVGK